MIRKIKKNSIQKYKQDKRFERRDHRYFPNPINID